MSRYDDMPLLEALTEAADAMDRGYSWFKDGARVRHAARIVGAAEQVMEAAAAGEIVRLHALADPTDDELTNLGFALENEDNSARSDTPDHTASDTTDDAIDKPSAIYALKRVASRPCLDISISHGGDGSERVSTCREHDPDRDARCAPCIAREALGVPAAPPHTGEKP